MKAAQIHYIVPGLLEASRLDAGLAGRGQFPALETILSKADHASTGGNSAQLLFEILALSHDDISDIPTAALSALAQLPVEQVLTSSWVQLDPVLLKPDRDQLLLYAPAQDPVAQDLLSVADLLLQNFDDVFSEILLTSNNCLLARLVNDFHIRTRPTAAVVGRSVQAFLPDGDNALSWHGIMNEIQMLLHTTAYAETRFNALWPHGYGRLPDGVALQREITLVGDDDLIRGLAGFVGSPQKTSAEFWAAAESIAGDYLIVDETIHEAIEAQSFTQWQKQMQQLDAKLAVLLQQCRSGQLRQLHLYDADGRHFCYRSKHRWRLWRKKSGISDW